MDSSEKATPLFDDDEVQDSNPTEKVSEEAVGDGTESATLSKPVHVEVDPLSDAFLASSDSGPAVVSSAVVSDQPDLFQQGSAIPASIEAANTSGIDIHNDGLNGMLSSVSLEDGVDQEISLADEDNDHFQDGKTFLFSDENDDNTARQTAPSTEASGLTHTFPSTFSAASAQIVTSPISPIQPVPIDSMEESKEEKVERESGDTFIEITISDPQKIGEGMGSYMAYKVTTKTNVPYFRKEHWSVTRRFSDFLGLHSKLMEKYLHSGLIVPPAPEKDAIASTKLKLAGDKGADVSAAEFIERRRASLQRYMMRTAAHPTLRTDPDFREFIELDAELPRATSTSAMSGAGVLRLFNLVGETVNKMTFKMDESDQWFEEKTQQIEALDCQLRKLHQNMDMLVGYRRELALSTEHFSKSAAVLSSVEEHSAMSRALHQLSEAMDRIHTVHHAQADADFFHLSETTKDYINILGAVKEVFHERIKVFQTWQHAQQTLHRKREAKAKAETSGRLDRVQAANEEVQEWEAKVERSQDHFNKISESVKKEIELFDIVRVVEFKDMLIKYLEAMITSQQQIVKVWETFLPEAKVIS